jgi:hypothetical protein
MLQISVLYEISCPHGDQYEDGCLPGYFTVFLLTDVSEELPASIITLIM